MKTIFKILLLLVLVSGHSNAQVKLNADQANKKLYLLYIIKSNGQKNEVVTRNLIIDLRDVENLELLSNDIIKKRFGTIKENVVMVITPKPSVTLITLPQFYKNHGLSEKDRSLPLSIDDMPITDTVNLLIQEKEIKSVKVENNVLNIISHTHYNNMLKKNKAVN